LGAAAEVRWGGHGARPLATRSQDIGGVEWTAVGEEPGSAGRAAPPGAMSKGLEGGERKRRERRNKKMREKRG